MVRRQGKLIQMIVSRMLARFLRTDDPGGLKSGLDESIGLYSIIQSSMGCQILSGNRLSRSWLGDLARKFL